MKRLLILVLVLLLVGSVALADVDLSGMTMAELSDLRDKINQAIQEMEADANGEILFDLGNDNFKMTFQHPEVVDYKTINDYYDQYEPGWGTNDDFPYLAMVFAIENNGSVNIKKHFDVEEASVNGWMVSGYAGMREVGAGKKAKGFLYLKMVDCDAETIDEVDSLEFTITLKDTDKNVIGNGTIHIVHSDDGWHVS